MKDGSWISDWFEKELISDVKYPPTAGYKTYIEGNLEEDSEIHLCHVDRISSTHHVLVSKRRRVRQW